MALISNIRHDIRAIERQIKRMKKLGKKDDDPSMIDLVATKKVLLKYKNILKKKI